MRRLYGDLLAARRRWPPLRDFVRRTARLLPEGERDAVLELVRGGPAAGAGATLQAYFNLTPRPQPLTAARPEGSAVLFYSEAERYGGPRRGAGAATELHPYECVVIGPAAWGRADENGR